MAERDLEIPVVVELGAGLDAALGADRLKALEELLRSRIAGLLAWLPLEGRPAIEVAGRSSDRALRVRVHGELQPYPPELMKRVWRAAAPPALRCLPDEASHSRKSGFPDAWCSDYMARDSPSGEAGGGLAVTYLAGLAFEIVRQCPSCLVGPAQAAAYCQAASLAVSPEAMMPALQSLLDWGIRLAGKHTALRHNGPAAARPLDLAEEAFSLLRSNRVEIHAHPEYLEALFGSDFSGEPQSAFARSAGAELLRLAEDNLFFELGMLLPDLVWIPSPETPAGMLAIRINDALEVAQPGLQSGEILVNAPPAQWTPAAPEARPCAHPVTGAECTILPETYREVAAGAGTVWTPAEFAALLLAAEARRLAERLLTIDDVEGQIAELDTAFPELTRAALARFSLEDITRVLRGLLRERISIRNLRGILEQLLRYDTVRAGSRTNIVLDGRLPVGNKAAGADGWLHYREFVRMGLRDQLSARYTHGLETLTAFLVAPEIEARAEDMMTAAGPVIAFDEDLHQSLCRAVWEEVGPVRAIASRAVILTAASTRAVIREMIAGEFPDLPVAAYSDLRPDLTIQPIARLGQKQSAQN